MTCKAIIKESTYVDIVYPPSKTVDIELGPTQNIRPGSIPAHVKEIYFSASANLYQNGILCPNVKRVFLQTWNESFIIPPTVEHLVINYYDGGKLPNVNNIYINQASAQYVDGNQYHKLFTSCLNRNKLIVTSKSKRFPQSKIQKMVTICGKDITYVDMVDKSSSTFDMQYACVQLDEDETILPESVPDTITQLTIIRNYFKIIRDIDVAVFKPNVETVILHTFDVTPNLPNTIKNLIVDYYDGRCLPNIENIYISPAYHENVPNIIDHYYVYDYNCKESDLLKSCQDSLNYEPESNICYPVDFLGKGAYVSIKMVPKKTGQTTPTVTNDCSNKTKTNSLVDIEIKHTENMIASLNDKLAMLKAMKNN